MSSNSVGRVSVLYTESRRFEPVLDNYYTQKSPKHFARNVLGFF